MKSVYVRLTAGFVLMFLMIGCGSPSPNVINDMSDASYQLVNQDNADVNFPGDFEGRPMIVAYIYTSCKTVCPAITANMKNISRKLSDDRQAQFVLITFDPMRDDPQKLRQYRKTFELDPQRFTLLTGDSTTVDSLMGEIGIQTNIIPADSTGKNMGYMFTHTNQINLFDRQGRIRGEYGGSMVPPENIREDLEKLN